MSSYILGVSLVVWSPLAEVQTVHSVLPLRTSRANTAKTTDFLDQDTANRVASWLKRSATILQLKIEVLGSDSKAEVGISCSMIERQWRHWSRSKPKTKRVKNGSRLTVPPIVDEFSQADFWELPWLMSYLIWSCNLPSAQCNGKWWVLGETSWNKKSSCWHNSIPSLATLEPWNLETLKPWNLGTLEPWNLGTLFNKSSCWHNCIPCNFLLPYSMFHVPCEMFAFSGWYGRYIGGKC